MFCNVNYVITTGVFIGYKFMGTPVEVFDMQFIKDIEKQVVLYPAKNCVLVECDREQHDCICR